MASTTMTGLWIAMEGLRAVRNRGFDHESLRVWFIGDNHALVKDRTTSKSGHLEVLFPFRPSELTVDSARELLLPRVHAALDRQIQRCL